MTEPTQPIRDNATRPGAEQARDPRMHRWVPIGMALCLLGVLGLALVLWLSSVHDSDQINGLQSQVGTYASDAHALASQVRGLGATPVVQPPVAGPVGPAGPSGAQGAGATQQQIDDSVSRYFQVNPPGATPAMVAVQVAAYLTAHPPVTQAQITTAASDFISAHPELFRGQPGATGQPGQTGVAGADGKPGANATDAQVASAVAAFCSDHNGCTGAQGPQGVSETDGQFVRNSSGVCTYVVTFSDGHTVTHPAGDAACPLAPLLPIPGR